VQPTECSLLGGTDTAARHDEEVAVAGGVAAAEREQAGEVEPDEVPADDRANAAEKLRQEIVQLRLRGVRWAYFTFTKPNIWDSWLEQ
jgi:hypothetical protein